MYLNCQNVVRNDLDLDLDSSRIQLDTLDSDAIRICKELPPLLPPRCTPSFVGLCLLYSSSLLLVDPVLSCILVPASTVLAVSCSNIPGSFGRENIIHLASNFLSAFIGAHHMAADVPPPPHASITIALVRRCCRRGGNASPISST